MKKIRVAFVGCGRISDHYKKILLSNKTKNIKIVATCDISFNKAKTLSLFFNCKAFKLMEDMIKKISIDLIFLLTPSGIHYKNAKYI